MKFRDVVRRLTDRGLSALRDAAGSKYALLLVGLTILLVAGAASLTDYGSSLDEERNEQMGKLFLSAYRKGSFLRSPGIGYFNGPFYFMLFTVTSRLFHALNHGWLLRDGLHLTNYVTFLVGVFFFYRMALRLFPRGVALLATALFTSQPVLFGHAFINQKDTPLMVFFLASVELGWTAVEARRSFERRQEGGGRDRPPREGVAEQWRRLSLVRRRWIALAGFLGVILLLDLWWVGSLQRGATSILEDVYAGRGLRLLAQLFARIAEDAYKTPLSAYVAKVDSFFAWSRVALTAVIVVLGVSIWRAALPASYSGSLGKLSRHWGMVLVAGIVLGMATAMRALAPFAGVLVAAYWIGRSGRRALPGLVVYGAVAAATTYLMWPALWGHPLLALTERASGLSNFTGYAVHLWGVKYLSGELPWQYLPTLLTIQLTLPAVFLFLVAVPYTWILSRSDRVRRLLVVLLWTWFLIPIASVVLGLFPVYHNFRHVLFALPPAFLIMGFGGWKLLEVLKAPVLQAGLVVVALAPGILGIVRLHPYEYIYYNELVGGVRGAEGRFDLDYWCTGFREAMNYVNREAEAGDRIAFTRLDLRAAAPFARDDLRLEEGGDEAPNADFALKCRIATGQVTAFSDMETVYEVRADGALLAVVKQRAQRP